jgi:glycosyltransferase involved in cell wall biosynthesis
LLDVSRVLVVVPAFQEEAHVAEVIATMPAFVDAIVLVDDGCTDRTSERALAVGDPRLRIERHSERRGVGAAIVSGYRRALELTDRDTDALCVMAGDGQMDPRDLEAVALPVVRGGADYVKGNRFGDPSVRQSMGSPRWLGGQVFSRLTSAAIGQPISDSQCGFTALARGAALNLDLEGLWPGFGYPNDLLGQLAARDRRIAEVAVRPIYGTETSKLRLRHLPPIFYLVGRAALRRRRRRVI